VNLHRFFLPPDSFQGDRVSFPANVSRQLDRVLRLRAGDRVIALDGSGAELTVMLESVGGAATGVVEHRRRNDAEPRINLVLYQALLKGHKFELVLQKGTEIGVSRFVPVETSRSVPQRVSAPRLNRYRDIVREAAEQSGRGVLPLVEEPLALAPAVRKASGDGPVVFLWEEERAMRLSAVQMADDAPCLALFVGPEGGFTDTEAQLARDAGSAVATLGARVLRAETAAIVGTTLLLSRLGELG
jgi:16S rRNA (uracil1498-N3)-methyltransferase